MNEMNHTGGAITTIWYSRTTFTTCWKICRQERGNSERERQQKLRGNGRQKQDKQSFNGLFSGGRRE